MASGVAQVAGSGAVVGVQAGGALGRNQRIALAYLAKRGQHAPTGAGNRPWQFDNSGYRRVLASLVKKGLAQELSSGVRSFTLGGGAVRMANSQRFTPHFVITEAGSAALARIAA